MKFKPAQLLKTPRNAIGAIFCGMLVCGCVFAQQTEISEVQRYQRQIQECNRIIGTWQWQADTQNVVVILVILCGALITAFQKLEKNWCRPATVALGVAVTILTGINAKVFSADYRVLKQSAIDGRDLVDQLDSIVENLKRPQADIAGLESQWMKIKTQFSGLQKAVLQGTNKLSSLQIWEKTVYAQSSAPAWYMRPPVDDYNLYFKGVAEDRSIEAARHQSFDNAVAAGVAALSTGKTTDGDRLRNVIASSAEVDRNYFEFDKGKGVYRYYTLVRISNDIKNITFISAPHEKAASVVVNPEPARWRELAPHDLLHISNQNRTVNPRLSLNLILHAISITRSAHAPITVEERTTLQTFLWKKGWVPTYRALGRNMGINAVDVSSDGKLLATAHDNQTAQIWSISSGEPLYTLQACHRGSVEGIDFSHDGSTIATGCLDGNVKLWSAASGKDLGFHIQTVGRLSHVIFNPDGSRLLTQEEGSIVKVWSVPSGALLFTLTLFPGQTIRSISYAPSGALLATGFANGTIALWDAVSGSRRGELVEFNSPVFHLMFSDDGRQLIATSGDGYSKIIDVMTHHVTRSYSSHGKQVTLTAAFTHQGRLFLVGNASWECRVWDALSGEDMVVLPGQGSWRQNIGISNDGMKLVFWNNSTVRMMPIKVEDAISEARKRAEALSPSECSQYLNVRECPELNLP